MELKVGDGLNADPRTDDIVRAIDARPKGANWHIRLHSDGGDHIEAFAAEDGLYRLAFVDRGRGFDAARPIDAETLKTVLVYYLNGDIDWRRQCRFAADKSKGSRAKASRRISAEPPAWAVILVVASFFTVLLPLALPDSWRAGLPEGFGIVAIFVMPFFVMALAMVANKMLVARRASRWSQAAGRITKSIVAARHRQKAGAATDVSNVPVIEYEFTANGGKFTGTRISIGEDTGGANTEATLARYPVGTPVTVYYDPADPESCVLEREIPKEVPKGCLAILAILAVLGFGGHWAVTRFSGFIEPYMESGQGRTVVIATGIGLVLLMLFFGSRFAAKEGKGWPVVRGKVVESGTENYRRTFKGHTSTYYAPVVEYSYLVNVHEYRSRQIKLEDKDEGTRAEAEQIAARYPKGSDVDVHYDPEYPGSAALENPARTVWVLLALAVGCFGVAIYAAEFYRWQ